MKHWNSPGLNGLRALLVLLALAAPAFSWAQDESGQPRDVHPMLNTRFLLTGGVFWPQKEFNLRVDGTIPGEDVDFDEAFRFDESDATGMISFQWRLSRNWTFAVEAWELDSSGGAILTEDIVWDDLIFREGTFATAGVDLSVARIFFGRRLWTGDTWETGAGIGAHWLDIGAFIEGEVRINDSTTEIRRGDADAAFPMPNLGFWYLQSLSPRWALGARVDWLDVSVDRYSGNLWNIQLGVHYQAWEKVGFSLHGQYFELDGRIKDSDWRGQVELKQYGPRASVYVTF